MLYTVKQEAVEMKEINIPVGISDFKEIRKNGYYYVDKTFLIKELLKTTATKVTLITRPRRFGKTMAMSMLADYFDIRENSQDLFEGLEISKETDLCKEWMNQWPVVFLSLKDIGFNEEIDENGTTFEENSLIKAKAIKAYCEKNDINEIIMTDDAGLCIDALNGEPGVYSARYAGDHAPQIVAINKVLSKMENVKDEDRTAKFVCVLTLMMPDGKINVARGETLGRIVRTPGPLGKLTYGPIFIPEGFDKTMNELTEEELGVTHREKALKQILNYLKEEQ